MSSNQFSFTSTSSSFSSSSFSSSSSRNGQTTGVRHATSSHSGPQGTTVRTASQTLGGPVTQETRHYDSHGRELLGAPSSANANANANTSRRIQNVQVEDVTEAEDAKQSEADKRYREAMEDEYAKREGGA